MKAQFKKADASGARYALIFGADELARGEVARQGAARRRDGAEPLPLADAGSWRRLTASDRADSPFIIAGCSHKRHGHPSRPRRAGTARPAEGVLEAVRQPHHLGARSLVLGGYAAWNGWNYTSATRARKAGALYDELERAAQAGDSERATRIFADMKERYPRTAFTQQAGLLAASVAAEKGQYDAAQRQPRLGRRQGGDDEYRAIARLRLAGLLLDTKKYDEALKQLDARRRRPSSPRLADDRRGDILLAQGKSAEAQARLPEGVDGDGPEARLPPPRRGQAQRARRAAGGGRARAAPRRRSDDVRGAARRPRRAPRRRWRAGRGCSAAARPARLRLFGADKPKPKRARADRRRRSRCGRPGTRASARSSSRSPSPSTATC